MEGSLVKKRIFLFQNCWGGCKNGQPELAVDHRPYEGFVGASLLPKLIVVNGPTQALVYPGRVPNEA